MNKSIQGKTAVVTGASSGIGSVTAQKLAQEGMQVVLVARRLEKLDALKDKIIAQGGKAFVIQADLEDGQQRLAVYQKALELCGSVHILINNAGFGWYGYFYDMTWETAQSMIHINVEAVAHLTRLFLTHMKANNQGHIINIGSIAGIFPNQGIAAYGASKAYVYAFSTALYRELRGTQIHVGAVLPGAVATELFDQSAKHKDGQRIPAERLAVSPHRVAARIWGMIKRPRRAIYVPGWLCILPWVELAFGWIIDMLGPVLLRRKPPPTEITDTH